MIEVIGDIWAYKADVRCITTNGAVKRDGKAVMGRGVALQANRKYPGLSLTFGRLLKAHGNRVLVLGRENSEFFTWLWSFPVKKHWMDKADLELIATSCEQATHYADRYTELYDITPIIVVPRPGCGNGQLDWETQVKPVVQDLLDDRFHVITNTP